MNRILLGLFVGWVALAGCQSTVPSPTPIILENPSPILPSPTPVPTVSAEPPVPATLPPALTPSPIPDTGWHALRDGLERRAINLGDDMERPFESIYLLRLDPNQFDVRIAYHPGQPQALPEWGAETEALVIVNGGFFTEEFVATGLMVVDEAASGTSYEGYGGMVTVSGGRVGIQSLAERPYDSNEPLQYALQSFPILVKPGGELGFPEEDGASARRTVIALDEDGRLLLILTRRGNFTLHQLSAWLVASDLNLEIALNLDGGPSSGLLLTEPREELLAFSALPSVIVIYPR